jgi:hypothetical protein
VSCYVVKLWTSCQEAWGRREEKTEAKLIASACLKNGSKLVDSFYYSIYSLFSPDLLFRLDL